MPPAAHHSLLATAAAPLLSKRQQTRAMILQAGLGLASQKGLEGLSVGALAEATGLSKSGLFAHFGSREALQLAVLDEYHQRFAASVFLPALRQPRGVPRLAALFEGWVQRASAEVDAGCLYIGGAVEFDDRPGPVRDALVAMVQVWRSALQRAIQLAIEAGHLQPQADVAQWLFDLQGLILALHHDARFLRLPGTPDRALAGFNRLLEAGTTAAGRRVLKKRVMLTTTNAVAFQRNPP